MNGTNCLSNCIFIGFILAVCMSCGPDESEIAFAAVKSRSLQVIDFEAEKIRLDIKTDSIDFDYLFQLWEKQLSELRIVDSVNIIFMEQYPTSNYVDSVREFRSLFEIKRRIIEDGAHSAINTMLIGVAASCEQRIDGIIGIWIKCIEVDVDVSEWVKQAVDVFDSIMSLDSVMSICERELVVFQPLDRSPQSMHDAYDALESMYLKNITLIKMYQKPTGSLLTYSAKKREIIEVIMAEHNKYKLAAAKADI